MNNWLLPAGINESLPAEATALEAMRRELLDVYRGWGYGFVMPPLVEYLESLSIAMGSQLDVQTFKITDQTNGRMMGLRADITPQVARIDSHRMSQQPNQPNRFFKQNDRVSALVGRICIRKMKTNISESCCTQKGIRNGVQQDIGV